MLHHGCQGAQGMCCRVSALGCHTRKAQNKYDAKCWAMYCMLQKGLTACCMSQCEHKGHCAEEVAQ